MSCHNIVEMDSDLALALKLQDRFDEEYSLSQKKKSFLDVNDEPSSKMSLIDPSLEYLDPTPDIYSMFVNFDKKFFWSSLGSVSVTWSSRMTSCAGICRYRSRNGETTISLSLPLLKLRPRKDLVETLLHEMIHAYLFVTRNNRDRDGHGPEFQSHMHRINKSAGTNITVYHSFHAEVDLYKTHWWRCNGPCQNWKPFYGFVKRATNRAPAPNDFWFADHQSKCGGTFIKVKEPENYGKKKKLPESGKQLSSPSNVRTLQNYFKKVNTKPRVNNGVLGPSGPKNFPASSSKKEGRTFTSMKSGSFTVTKPASTSKGGVPPATKSGSISKGGMPAATQSGTTSKGGVTTATNSGSTTKVNNHTATKVGTSTATNAGASTTSKGGASARSVMTFSNLADKEDAKDSQTSSTSSRNIVTFSGKGYTLGTTSVPITDKPWLKRFNTVVSNPTATKSASPARHSSASTTASSKDPKKLRIDDSNGKSKEIPTACTVACPVCGNSLKASEINNHLDLCLSNTLLQEETEDYDSCVACNQTLDRKWDVPKLCTICEQGACSYDFDGACSKSDDISINCPMCEKKMSNSDLERHLELCIKAEDEDNQTRICDEDEDDDGVIVLD